MALSRRAKGMSARFQPFHHKADVSTAVPFGRRNADDDYGMFLTSTFGRCEFAEHQRGLSTWNKTNLHSHLRVFADKQTHLHSPTCRATQTYRVTQRSGRMVSLCGFLGSTNSQQVLLQATLERFKLCIQMDLSRT